MITCTLGDKKYTVDFISGRALREMEPAAKMYRRIVAISNAAAKGEPLPEGEQTTQILDSFPTKAARETTEAMEAPQTEAS